MQGISNLMCFVVANPSFVYISSPAVNRLKAPWQLSAISFISWNYFPAGHIFHGCDFLGNAVCAAVIAQEASRTGFFLVSMVLIGTNISPLATSLSVGFLAWCPHWSRKPGDECPRPSLNVTRMIFLVPGTSPGLVLLNLTAPGRS